MTFLYALAGWLVLSVAISFVLGRCLARAGRDYQEWRDLRTPQRQRKESA